jgi:DNA-binding MarR family transcriptional regulator
MAIEQKNTKRTKTDPAFALTRQRGAKSWLAVIQTYNLCYELLGLRLAKNNAPVAEHEILINLLRAPGSTQQHIAQRCFATKSGISMLLSKLEGNGLVRREPDQHDARVKLVFLTPIGLQTAKQSMQVQKELVELMAGELTDPQLESIYKLMTKVCVRLDLARKESTTKPLVPLETPNKSIQLAARRQAKRPQLKQRQG